MARITKEKFKTYGNVFDEFTKRNLFRLASQGHIGEELSPVMIGKEANVFSAKHPDGRPVIVKIYRLETVDFRRMYDYIKFDKRYPSIKRSRRQIIFAWTQREFRNILKAREFGVRVPTPFTFMHNIIVMEFIGKKKPAPQLKDCYPNDPATFFETIVDYSRALYKGGIIHGDLSQFNILNDAERPVFIDFSQGLTTESMVADEYLMRDVKNICKFFEKHGLENNPDEVFKKIKK